MEVQLGIKRTAVLVLLKHKDQFLLLKRKNEPNKGMYTPVGGKLDPFEGPKAAAIRETREETGIALQDLAYKGTLIESAPNKYNWTCLVYLAEIDWQAPPPCNEGILEWIDYKDILKVPTPPTDWAIYQYVLEGRPFMFSSEYDDQLNMLYLEEELEAKVLYAEGKALEQ